MPTRTPTTNTKGFWIRRAFFLAASFSVVATTLLVPSVSGADQLTVFTDTARYALPLTTFRDTPYLNITDLLEMIGIPERITQTSDTFRFRLKTHEVILRANSDLAFVDNVLVALSQPVIASKQLYYVPLDFLERAVPRIAGQRVTLRAPLRRCFITSSAPNRLRVEVSPSALVTRLAIQADQKVPFELRPEPRALTILLGDKPLDWVRDRVPYSNELIDDIRVEESLDPASKKIFSRVRVQWKSDQVTTKPSVAEDGRVLIVEISKPAERPSAMETRPTRESRARTQAPAAAASAKPLGPRRELKVIMLDPGHGGEEIGGVGENNIQEKLLTLEIVRRLRSVLQARLGITVLLTRDSDTTLNIEQRATMANTNRADLFLSLHIGQALQAVPLPPRVYVYQTLGSPDANASNLAANKEATRSEANRAATSSVFIPWRSAGLINKEWNAELARTLQEELNALGNANQQVMPAPLAPLANVAMPAALIEIGNLHWKDDAAKLASAEFQNRLVHAIVTAVQKFKPIFEAGTPRGSTP